MTFSNQTWTPDVALLRLLDVKLLDKSARRHSAGKIKKLRAVIAEFGFVNPIIVDENLTVIAGVARVLAARDLGYDTIPAIVLRGLSEGQKRQLRLADNKLVLDAKWDAEVLATELQQIIAADLDPVLSGFDMAEIDAVLLPEPLEAEEDDDIEPPLEPVSILGDRWLCGPHLIYCGDATNPTSYQMALQGEFADVCFTDPPFNVRISRNVSGRGKVKHKDFVMGSGEKTKAQFREFLASALDLMNTHSRDGAVHYIAMDWRSIDLLKSTGELIFNSMLNLVVWSKTNAGMGSFYRSQHELIAVFKSGEAPHVNNVQLGRLGRYRTNVWTYPGNTSNTKTRARELAEHPTVKPAMMIAEAILDASNKGDLVLDPFGGSGSTLIAANSVGRRAVLIELDPGYVDVTLRRYIRATGQQPTLEGAGTFDEVAAVRAQSGRVQ